MYKEKGPKHASITLRPPPATRFTIWQADVELEFEKGKEEEIVTWLLNWIFMYVEPLAKKKRKGVGGAKKILNILEAWVKILKKDIEDFEQAETQPPTLSKAELGEKNKNEIEDRIKREMKESIAAREAILGPLMKQDSSNPKIEIENGENNHGKREDGTEDRDSGESSKP